MFASLDAVYYDEWVIKVSVLAGQTLIAGYNKASLDSFIKICYNEEEVEKFLEKIIHD